jgi:hypothetical protein
MLDTEPIIDRAVADASSPVARRPSPVDWASDDGLLLPSDAKQAPHPVDTADELSVWD